MAHRTLCSVDPDDNNFTHDNQSDSDPAITQDSLSIDQQGIPIL